MSRAWDYQKNWPVLVFALEEGWAKARIVRARKHHACEVAHLDLGTAPVHWLGIRPGDRYVRVHAFTDDGPVSGAVCVNCAGLFGHVHALVDEINRLDAADGA